MQVKDPAIVAGVVILAILFIALMGGGMMVGPMMGWHHYSFGQGEDRMALGWWEVAMAIGMLLFWLLIIAAGVWLVTSLLRQRRPGGERGDRSESALDILRGRYARGELSREQFQEMRRDLEGP